MSVPWQRGLHGRLVDLRTAKGFTPSSPLLGLEAELAEIEAFLEIIEPPATWGHGLEARLALIEATDPPVSFPSGIVHAWKFEEGDGGDAADSVGSNTLVATGVHGVVAGASGLGIWNLGTAAGRYYTSGPFTGPPSAITLAGWLKIDFNPTVLSGPLNGEGVLSGIDIGADENGAWAYVNDPVTGEASGVYTTGGLSVLSGWALLVARIDLAGKTGNTRKYGFLSGNGVTSPAFSVVAGSGWVNALSSFVIRPRLFNLGFFGSCAGGVDEIMAWDRLLSDAECDALAVPAFYTP